MAIKDGSLVGDKWAVEDNIVVGSPPNPYAIAGRVVDMLLCVERAAVPDLQGRLVWISGKPQ
jgi:hypothetical protein